MTDLAENDGQHRASLPPSLPWSALRAVGNSSAAKATILIPLIGYLLIFNDSVVKYLNLWNALFDKPDSHVSFRLLSLYFGLCSVALASAVYAYFCPREVKSYDSAAKYIGSEGENLSTLELKAIVDRLAEQSPKEFTHYVEAFGKSSAIKSLDDHRQNNVEAESIGLSTYYNYLDRTHPSARALTGLAFGVGFILLLIPSAMVFWRAMKLLGNAL